MTRDQEAGYREEDVNAYIATGDQAWPVMKYDDSGDRDSAQRLNLGANHRSQLTASKGGFWPLSRSHHWRRRVRVRLGSRVYTNRPQWNEFSTQSTARKT